LLKQAKEHWHKCRKNIVQTLRRFLHRKEDNNMVDLYTALIISGRRTFSQVPARFQDAVRADLAALGLDENGNPIAE
jgi:hypothetical protein